MFASGMSDTVASWGALMNDIEPVLERLAVGSLIRRKGFFTRRLMLGSLSNGVELERRVGYQPGRLRYGWYVLTMKERVPTPNEFVFGGYTHFSGGRIQGHEKDPAKRGPHMDDSLRAMRIDVEYLKRQQVQSFVLDGPERLIKIVPALSDLDSEEAAIQAGKYWHPDPSPVPQWQLTAPMLFLVESHHRGTGA